MAVIYKLRSGITKVHGAARKSLSVIMSQTSSRKAGLITGISLLALTPVLAFAVAPSGQDASSSTFTVKTNSAQSDDSDLNSENGVSKVGTSTSIDVNSKTSGDSDSNGSDDSMSVSVNGEDVPTDNDDVVNKTINTNSSSTNLKIKIKTDNSTYSKNSTSLQIDNKQVNNESQSDLRDDRTSAHR